MKTLKGCRKIRLIESKDENTLKLRKQYDDLLSENSSLKTELINVNSNLKILQNDKHRLLEGTNTLQKQIDELQDDLKGKNTEYIDMKSQISTLTSSNLDLEGKLKPLEFKNQQLSQEINLLKNSHEQIQDNKLKESTERLNIERKYAQDLLSFKTKVTTLEDELKLVSKQLDNEKERNQKYIIDLDNITLSHKNEIDKLLNDKADIESSLTTQTRLVKLYEEKLDIEATNRIKVEEKIITLETLIANEKDNTTTIIDEYKNKISKLEDDIIKYQENLKVEEKKSIINEKKYNEINELYQSLKEATSTDDINNNDDSSSSSQPSKISLFDKYMNIKEELRLAKQDHQTMEAMFNQVQREVQAKVPLIQEQKYQYNKLLATNEELTNKLKAVHENYDILSNKSHEIEDNYNNIIQDNKKLTIENNDLAKQVQSLLSAQALKDQGIAPSFNSTTIPNADEVMNMSANEVISTHLVSINSIADMQQNQLLLSQLRECTEIGTNG